MSKVIFILLALTPTACGTAEVTPTVMDFTKHGYALIYDIDDPELEEVKVEEVELLIDAMLMYFSATTNIPKEEVLDALARWEANHQLYIELTSYRLPCPTDELPERTCSGLYYHNGHMQIVWKDYSRDRQFCPGITSLTHEFGHHLAKIIFGDSDGKHRDARIFYKPESASVLASWYYIDRRCPWILYPQQ